MVATKNGDNVTACPLWGYVVAIGDYRPQRLIFAAIVFLQELSSLPFYSFVLVLLISPPNFHTY